MVECDLAKVEVAGSNPVSRSRFLSTTLDSSNKSDSKFTKKALGILAGTWAIAENQVT